MPGYERQILRVDLSRREVITETLGEETIRKFIGGAGLAASILWKETGADTVPLSEQNCLVFAIGPLTGTHVPASSRYTAAALSPLTGIWGEAHAGGSWGWALGHTPYLAIIFSGKASAPVYLYIEDGKTELRDAGHVWGKDIWETDELLKRETSPNASVAAIGPAGEKLIKMAAIINDGRRARAAARCGIGAVMGYKRLKAVVVNGTGRPPVRNESGLKQSVNQYLPAMKLDREHLKKTIALRLGGRLQLMGPVKNWTLPDMAGFDDKLVAAWQQGEPAPCKGCRFGCRAGGLAVNGQRHVHGELLYPFGSNCLIDDFDALIEANNICNRYGLDNISAGQSIAFAMELYEKGLLTQKDTDGVELKWGNADAMLKVLRKMGEKEGFGELLGEGVREVARRIGGLASEYAIHVKGLEFPLFDPRYRNTCALQYATSNRGADHLDGHTGLHPQRGASGYLTSYASLHVGDEDARNAGNDPFAVKGIGKITAWSQNFDAIVDSLQVCKFVARTSTWLVKIDDANFTGVEPEKLLEWLNLTTGWDMDFKTMLLAGERIFNLKRQFNVRRGISRKDDFLPPRILTCPRGGASSTATNLPPLGEMLNEYYAYRGWSEEGLPTKEKLRELSLL